MSNFSDGDVLQATHIITNMGESLTRYNLLSKTTSEGVWDFNFITGAVYYNETIYALLGYSEEDMQDNITWWRSNIHPNDKERVINEIDALLLSADHNWWGEYAFRCKNGLYKNVFERLYVVRDKQGKPVRIIGTMMDLDPITKLHSDLENERLAFKREIMRVAINSTEQERKEISDELHENINQVLAAINLHIEAAKKHIDVAGAEWLNNAQDLLLDSMNGIRTLSKRLSPLTFKTFGLINAIKEDLEDFKKAKHIEYFFDYEKAVIDSLSDDKKLLLYRILQIYIQAIDKSMNISFLHLLIANQEDKIKLSVKDNGNAQSGNDMMATSFSRIQMLSDAYSGKALYHCRPGQGCLLEIIF
jgi:two-component system, NarL family, sensor histidine kinase UhpB